MARAPVVSDGLVLTFLERFWLAVKTALTFVSHRGVAGVQKTGLDVHHISLANGSADVLGYEVSPANAY